MNLDHLVLFQCIVEKGSLAAAGRELGLSATTVSERLNALESHYGVTLLHRTTRAISLTEEGRTLLTGARQLLSEAQELENRVLFGAQTLSGLIRISAPFDVGRSFVDPVITEFLAENPQVSIELLLSDGYVNIVDQGIDIAVRYGNLADSSLRTRSLGKYLRVVCASPEYIANYGKPDSLEDLEKHNCLLMRFGTELDNVWYFQVDDAVQQFIVNGNRVSNDGRLVHDWCLAGHGVAFKSSLDVEADIQSGALVRLLDDYSSPPITLQILFPPSRTPPLRVREFANKLSAVFK